MAAPTAFNALGAGTLGPASEFGAMTAPGEFAPFGDITSPAVTFTTPEGASQTKPVNPNDVRTERATFSPVDTTQIRPATGGLGLGAPATPGKVSAGPTGSSEGNLGSNRALANTPGTGTAPPNLSPQLMRHLFSVLAARRRTAV